MAETVDIDGLKHLVVRAAKPVHVDGEEMGELATHLFPNFYLFFKLIQRYYKKHSSSYTRAALVSLGICVFASRHLKGYLVQFVKNHFMSCVEVHDGNEVHEMLISWISRQHFSQDSRNFMARIGLHKNSKETWLRAMGLTGSKNKNKGEPDPNALHYTPSKGTYHFWFKRNLYFFTRISTDSNVSDNLSVSCFGRSPQNLKNLLEECQKDFKKNDEGMTAIYNADSSRSWDAKWTRGTSRISRPFSTVVLDDEVKASIVADMEKYLDTEQKLWYEERGIPYRRGYLLHGPPGTGKSSLTFAIAGYFKLKIYIISLNSSKMGEETLQQLFALLPPKCIVLIEDIDAAGMSKDRNSMRSSDGDKISLSSLLNVIDGVASAEGRILIMTTNHLEHLDEALIRPGRVDMMVEFKLANKPQLVQIFENLFHHRHDVFPDSMSKTEDKAGANGDKVVGPIECNDAERLQAQKEEAAKAWSEKISALAKQFADNVPSDKFSPAEIQGYLVRFKDTPENAVENATAWAVETIASKAVAAAAKKKEEEKAEERESKAKAKEMRKSFQHLGFPMPSGHHSDDLNAMMGFSMRPGGLGDDLKAMRKKFKQLGYPLPPGEDSGDSEASTPASSVTTDGGAPSMKSAKSSDNLEASTLISSAEAAAASPRKFSLRKKSAVSKGDSDNSEASTPTSSVTATADAPREESVMSNDDNASNK